jgi:hypothetical protein
VIKNIDWKSFLFSRLDSYTKLHGDKKINNRNLSTVLIIIDLLHTMHYGPVGRLILMPIPACAVEAR